jgi:probable HAF family extracellular repeat protein
MQILPRPSSTSLQASSPLAAKLAVLVAFLVSVGDALCAAQYTIADLGNLGPAFARGRAINDHGQTTGEALISGQGIVQRAFRSQSGAMTDLGTLGGLQSAAFGINIHGTVAGWAHDAAGKALPTLWQGGVATALPTLGGTGGSAWGINDSGAAVGNSYLPSSTFHAALWSEGVAYDLGTLGGSFSLAYDINNHGVVAGKAADSTEGERAVLWSNSGIVDLGSLSGGDWNAVRAINDEGAMVFWGRPEGATANRAAFWDGHPDSGVIDLGTLGGPESWAYGLNDLGYVVGYAEVPDWTYRAFVWDGSEMTDLGTLGGRYSGAHGINNQGVIVGWATDALGNTHAVQWTPVPEPSGVTLALLGGGLVWFWRRRNGR